MKLIFFLLKNFITEQFNKENALGLGNVFAFAFEKLEDLQEKISSKFQRDQPSITDLLKRNKQEFEILIEKETKKMALNQF